MNHAWKSGYGDFTVFLLWDVTVIPHTPTAVDLSPQRAHISGPINLPMHSSSDTSHTHAGHCACAAEPHMHSQCFRGWPFFLADQMATWQLEQMPHRDLTVQRLWPFTSLSLPFPAFFLSAPPKSGPVWH